MFESTFIYYYKGNLMLKSLSKRISTPRPRQPGTLDLCSRRFMDQPLGEEKWSKKMHSARTQDYPLAGVGGGLNHLLSEKTFLFLDSP
jgi:hypothetical protein